MIQIGRRRSGQSMCSDYVALSTWPKEKNPNGGFGNLNADQKSELYEIQVHPVVTNKYGHKVANTQTSQKLEMLEVLSGLHFSPGSSSNGTHH
jgi:hypothetical protein